MGFLGPYALLAKIAAALVVVAAVFFGGYHYRDLSATADIAKLNAEHTAEVQKLKDQLTEIQLGLEKAKADAEEQVRTLEQNHAKKVNSISSSYEGKIKELKNEQSNVGVAITTDGLWLDVQVATCRKSVAATGAGTGLGDGTARCRLSEAAARFLGTLAFDADQIAAQLAAAQAVIDSDRNLK